MPCNVDTGNKKTLESDSTQYAKLSQTQSFMDLGKLDCANLFLQISVKRWVVNTANFLVHEVVGMESEKPR